MQKNIPYSRQSITKKDIKAVTEVLKSEYITQGKKNVELEKKISKFVSAKYAIAVNSGTSALHLSCLSLGLKKGDIVWTSPISFVASANSVLMSGLTIDFVDINRHTINIDVNKLNEKLKFSSIRNRLPKAIIVVHIAGLPCDMLKIKRLSNY